MSPEPLTLVIICWQVSGMTNNQRFQPEMGHAWNSGKLLTELGATLLIPSHGATPFLYTHSTSIKCLSPARNWARQNTQSTQHGPCVPNHRLEKGSEGVCVEVCLFSLFQNVICTVIPWSSKLMTKDREWLIQGPKVKGKLGSMWKLTLSLLSLLSTGLTTGREQPLDQTRGQWNYDQPWKDERSREGKKTGTLMVLIWLPFDLEQGTC